MNLEPLAGAQYEGAPDAGIGKYRRGFRLIEKFCFFEGAILFLKSGFKALI